MTSRSPDHEALGLAVRELRAEARISQEALADLSGLHRTYVGGIERGQRNVGFANLLRLASALSVSPARLIERYEHHVAPRGADRRERSG